MHQAVLLKPIQEFLLEESHLSRQATRVRNQFHRPHPKDSIDYNKENRERSSQSPCNSAPAIRRWKQSPPSLKPQLVIWLIRSFAYHNPVPARQPQRKFL